MLYSWDRGSSECITLLHTHSSKHHHPPFAQIIYNPRVIQVSLCALCLSILMMQDLLQCLGILWSLPLSLTLCVSIMDPDLRGELVVPFLAALSSPLRETSMKLLRESIREGVQPHTPTLFLSSLEDAYNENDLMLYWKNGNDSLRTDEIVLSQFFIEDFQPSFGLAFYSSTGMSGRSLGTLWDVFILKTARVLQTPTVFLNRNSLTFWKIRIT